MQIKLERVAGLFSEDVEQDTAASRPGTGTARQSRRHELLREHPLRRLGRIAQVVWRSLHPSCLATLVPTFDLLWREKTIGVDGLPDPEMALNQPDGLVGLAPDLTPGALLAAYARGLHPRCLAGPATYWAPAKRLSAHPANLKYDNALRTSLHKGEYGVTIDPDFDALVDACRGSGPCGPRLNPKIVKAHIDMFDAGLAHGFEVVDRSGQCVGGAYGVAFGRNFILERWFGNTGATRVGLAILARHLALWGFKLLDGTNVPALISGMGLSEKSRSNYNFAIEANMGVGRPGIWRNDPALYTQCAPATSVRRLFDPPQVTSHDPETLDDMQRELFATLQLELPSVDNTKGETPVGKANLKQAA